MDELAEKVLPALVPAGPGDVPGISENLRPDGLTARQEIAAQALASGQSVMDAAAAAGVSDRTVREWRTTIPAFSDYVAALRHELRDAAVGGLAALATRAVTVIDGLLNSENESIRLSAARVVTGAIPSEQTGVAAGNPVNVQVNVIQDACRGLSPDQLARVQERLRVVTPELNVDD